jgi:hypothetical protein
MNRKLLGAALEKALTNLIEQRRKQPLTPCGGVEIPLIGVIAIYNDKGVEDAKEVIVRALERQAQWEREKPLAWLPSLPLDETGIGELNAEIKKPEDTWLFLLGNYAWSLRQAWWDPAHPGFNDFVAGRLASPKCDWTSTAATALEKVRPKPLPGFNDETMCWERRLMPKSEEIPAKTPPAGSTRVETGLAR